MEYQFVTNSELHLGIPVDLIDMEAYALHKTCEHHHTRFDCFKYVTDSSDEDASSDWVENVAKGARLIWRSIAKSLRKILTFNKQ